MKIALLQCATDTAQAPYAEHDPPAGPARFAVEHEWTEIAVSQPRALHRRGPARSGAGEHVRDDAAARLAHDRLALGEGLEPGPG